MEERFRKTGQKADFNVKSENMREALIERSIDRELQEKIKIHTHIKWKCDDDVIYGAWKVK